MQKISCVLLFHMLTTLSRKDQEIDLVFNDFKSTIYKHQKEAHKFKF